MLGKVPSKQISAHSYFTIWDKPNQWT